MFLHRCLTLPLGLIISLSKSLWQTFLLWSSLTHRIVVVVVVLVVIVVVVIAIVIVAVAKVAAVIVVVIVIVVIAMIKRYLILINLIVSGLKKSVEEFEIMCHHSGSLWRQRNLNVTPKVHMMEHLPKIMQMYGRIGLFNENPIERVHILNNRWNKMLESLKSWEHLVQLKFQRENVCKTKPVYDALSTFAEFHMRKSKSTQKGSGHSHVSFAEIIKLIGDFDKNQDDLDDQLKDLISPETQVYDMEGGMEEVDLGVGVVAVGDT